MKRYYTIYAIIATLPLAAQAADRIGNSRMVIGVDPDLKAGEVALHAGDHQLAIKKLLAGLPNASSNRARAMTLNNLCAAYSLAGEYDISLDYCDQALQRNAASWRAYQNRARSLIGKGEIADAIEAAKRGLAIAPESPLLKRTLEMAQRLDVKPHVIIDSFEADRDRQ